MPCPLPLRLGNATCCIFSAIVPDLTEAAQFKVQLPVAGTSKDSLQENFARALRQQRPDWPVSLHQVTQTLQYVEEAPVIEVRGPTMTGLGHGGLIMLMSVHGRLRKETASSVIAKSGLRCPFSLAR